MKKIKELFDFKLLIVAIASAIIHVFAIVNFSIPASLYPAGFSGVSRLISDISYDFFKKTISYSILYFSLNIIATLIVYKKIGKKFALYSVIQFVLVSFLSSIIKPFIFIEDKILMSIFGGIINGVGVGLALSSNFSTGGFDFFSVFFANKYKKDVWNYVFAINVCILMIAGLLYGWQRSLYSVIYQFSSTYVVKTLHKRYTHKTLTIITKYPEEVSSNILKNVRHGITEIKATGFYSKDETTMLYTVVNSFQYKEVIKAVIDEDPHAFINVQNTIAIYGNYYQKPLD